MIGRNLDLPSFFRMRRTAGARVRITGGNSGGCRQGRYFRSPLPGLERICRLAVAAPAAAKGLAALPLVTVEKGGEGTRRPTTCDR